MSPRPGSWVPARPLTDAERGASGGNPPSARREIAADEDASREGDDDDG